MPCPDASVPAVARIRAARVVLVDAAGTLFHPRVALGALLRDIAVPCGIDASPERMESVFRSCWANDRRDHPLSGPTTAGEDRARWDRLALAVLDRLGGCRNPPGFLDGFYRIHGDPACWRLFPGVESGLAALAGGGRRLAVVSNWDSRLFGLVAGMGLGRWFEVVFASAPFGAAKPDASIFRAALAHFGAAPAETVFIGDSLEDDVHGAEACGIPAVWFCPAGRVGTPAAVARLTAWDAIAPG